MKAPLVDVDGLHKVFELGGRSIAAVRGVSLAIESGSYLAIMGASGSGKSTLLHILGCLERPTRGTYRLGGQDVTGLDDRELSRIRRTRIGFVFQTYNLVPELSVLRNVELPFLYGEVPAREARRRVLAAVERVGLTERLKHRPAELSGGEMQRVAIARALAVDPMLLLADEPTGNLDSETGAEILAVFDELNRDGVSLVVVTHDRGVAEHAESRMRMKDGRLEREASAA